jgi:hypothetical protein
MPTEEEWTLVQATLAVLKPFELVTRMLSGSTYTTLSMVMPMIKVLAESLTRPDDDDDDDNIARPEITALKGAMLQSLEKRWKAPGMLALQEPRFRQSRRVQPSGRPHPPRIPSIDRRTHHLHCFIHTRARSFLYGHVLRFDSTLNRHQPNNGIGRLRCSTATGTSRRE